MFLDKVDDNYWFLISNELIFINIFIDDVVFVLNWYFGINIFIVIMDISDCEIDVIYID